MPRYSKSVWVIYQQQADRWGDFDSNKHPWRAFSFWSNEQGARESTEKLNAESRRQRYKCTEQNLH